MEAITHLIIDNGQEEEIMLRSVKITEQAHKAVQLAKNLDGIKISEWMSTVILEAIQKEFPDTWRIHRDRFTKEQEREQEKEQEKS